MEQIALPVGERIAYCSEDRWFRVDREGRSLEVLVVGDPDRVPLVFHAGQPMAAVRFDGLVRAAARHGLSLVTWSRPGYARSTPFPGRTVAAVVEDTSSVLDELGAGDFVSLGWSGGGSSALACAALLSERCRGAACVAGLAPHSAEGLEWLAGMGPENEYGYTIAVDDAAQLSELLEAIAPGMAEADDIAQIFPGAVCDVDRAVLTGDFARFLAASTRRGLSTGIAGWRDDMLASVHEWGFDPSAIHVPLAIWHGAQDLMVPVAHGTWLAAHVRGAVAHALPGEGHLSLLARRVDDIVEELVTLTHLI